MPKIFLVGFKSQLPPQLMKNKEICKISVLICSATAIFVSSSVCQSANLQTLHLSCQIFQTEIDQEIEIWRFNFSLQISKRINSKSRKMDWMEPTQRLDSTDSDSQSVNDQSVADEKKVFGKLCLQDGSTHEFNIYKGDNLVGRDPSKCQILLSSASLSRIHAVIEGQKVRNS